MKGPAAADLRETRAWVYLDAVAGHERSEARVRALGLQHARLMAYHARDLDQAGAQRLADETRRVEDAVDRELLPWLSPRDEAADVRALETQWEAMWGAKMDSPEMQAKIQEACRRMAPAPRKPTRRRP